MHHYELMHFDSVARIITPGDLIGASEAAGLLRISKPTLTRRIAAGTLRPLAQIDGRAFVFDRQDILSLAGDVAPAAGGLAA